MKLQLNGSNQFAEVTVFQAAEAGEKCEKWKKVEEYNFPEADKKARQPHTDESYIKLEPNKRFKIETRYQGPGVQATAHLVIDGIYRGPSRFLQKVKNAEKQATDTAKKGRRITFSMFTSLERKVERKRRSGAWRVEHKAGKLRAVSIPSQDKERICHQSSNATSASVVPGIGSFAIVFTVPGDQFEISEPNPWSEIRMESRRDPKQVSRSTGISPDLQLTDVVKPSACKNVSDEFGNAFNALKKGQPPIATLIFHYRTAKAIDDAGCLLRKERRFHNQSSIILRDDDAEYDKDEEDEEDEEDTTPVQSQLCDSFSYFCDVDQEEESGGEDRISVNGTASKLDYPSTRSSTRPSAERASRLLRSFQGQEASQPEEFDHAKSSLKRLCSADTVAEFSNTIAKSNDGCRSQGGSKTPEQLSHDVDSTATLDTVVVDYRTGLDEGETDDPSVTSRPSLMPHSRKVAMLSDNSTTNPTATSSYYRANEQFLVSDRAATLSISKPMVSQLLAERAATAPPENDSHRGSVTRSAQHGIIMSALPEVSSNARALLLGEDYNNKEGHDICVQPSMASTTLSVTEPETRQDLENPDLNHDTETALDERSWLKRTNEKRLLQEELEARKKRMRLTRQAASRKLDEELAQLRRELQCAKEEEATWSGRLQ